jgi:alkylation response protein AidB-like acyl-CoA dehydrogenase
MKTPGITVRPIRPSRTAATRSTRCSSTTSVPVENLIGEENKGWTYAKFLLGNERTGMAGQHFMPGPDYAHTASELLNNRKLSIYGGSNEIQRNIIAKAVLGL